MRELDQCPPTEIHAGSHDDTGDTGDTDTSTDAPSTDAAGKVNAAMHPALDKVRVRIP